MTTVKDQESLRAHISQLLGQWPERHEELLTCLSPQDEAWRLAEVELLSDALASEPMRVAMMQSALPQAWVESLERWLPVVLPLVGKRPMGSIFQMAEELGRHTGAERRKLDLIVERVLASADPAIVHRILTAYLGLGVGPLYLKELTARVGDRVEAAKAAIADGSYLEQLKAQAQLTQALMAMPVERDALMGALEASSQALKADFEHRLRLGLRSADPEHVLVSAALAWRWNQREQAALILERVTMSPEHVGALCTLAARLDPETAQHYLSLFIAEMSWGNPEDPDRELTPARIRLLLIGRALLPKLGSAMAPLDESALGPLGQEPQVLAALHHATALFEALTPA